MTASLEKTLQHSLQVPWWHGTMDL